MRPPWQWSVRRGRAPVIPRPRRRERVPGACATVELRSRARMARCQSHLQKHAQAKKKNGFLREGAEAERACGAARLRPDWLPYDLTTGLASSNRGRPLLD